MYVLLWTPLPAVTLQCSYFESNLHFVFLLVTAVCPRVGQRGTTTGSVLPRLPALCVLWSPRVVHGLPDQKHIGTYCGMHGASLWIKTDNQMLKIPEDERG